MQLPPVQWDHPLVICLIALAAVQLLTLLVFVAFTGGMFKELRRNDGQHQKTHNALKDAKGLLAQGVDHLVNLKAKVGTDARLKEAIGELLETLGEFPDRNVSQDGEGSNVGEGRTFATEIYKLRRDMKTVWRLVRDLEPKLEKLGERPEPPAPPEPPKPRILGTRLEIHLLPTEDGEHGVVVHAHEGSFLPGGTAVGSDDPPPVTLDKEPDIFRVDDPDDVRLVEEEGEPSEEAPDEEEEDEDEHPIDEVIREAIDTTDRIRAGLPVITPTVITGVPRPPSFQRPSAPKPGDPYRAPEQMRCPARITLETGGFTDFDVADWVEAADEGALFRAGQAGWRMAFERGTPGRNEPNNPAFDLLTYYRERDEGMASIYNRVMGDGVRVDIVIAEHVVTGWLWANRPTVMSMIMASPRTLPR